MGKYFLIKNEIKKKDEKSGNVFTSKDINEWSNNFSYTLISKDVLHKILNAEMQRIEDEIYDLENNYNIKDYIKNPREEELKERIEIVVKRYNELMDESQNTISRRDNIPTINVFLSSLSDPEFLNDNKDILNNADLNIILNETEMNTVYKGQNMITLDDTLGGRFDESEFTEQRREYKDENATIDKYNLTSSEYINKIRKKIHPKSIVIKESLDSENEYTINELDIANHKVEEVANIINSQKGLSPYEKFYLAFTYVAKYEYKEFSRGNKEVSRNLLDVLNNNYIVCAGKANLLKAICDRIGIPCILRGAEVHSICTIGMNDPKYNIYGLQTIDPTNQKYPIMYNEDNNLPKNVFINNLNWISSLTYRQRDFLIEESGLFNVPEEKLIQSAELFRRDDENLLNIEKKNELIIYKQFASENKEQLTTLVNRFTEIKQKYDSKEDLIGRWVEIERNLEKITKNENEMMKEILKKTGAYKVAKDLCKNMTSIEDCYLHLYVDEDEFVNDCERLKIEPNQKSFEKLVKEFEKSVIPTINEIIKLLKNYSLNYDKNIELEISKCNDKITDEEQKDRFIPVDKNVKDIEKILDKVRTNHLENIFSQQTF